MSSTEKSNADTTPIDSTISVPLIDLANPGQRELDEIRSACEEWGIFYIINHGVSENILEEFKTMVIKLFTLPTDVKLSTLKTGLHESTGYGTGNVLNHSPNSLWHEGFSFGTHKELLELSAKLSPPNGDPIFCQVIESYKVEMKKLAERQLTLMLASLGLTPEDIDWSKTKTNEKPFGQDVTCFQILNSYPPCPDRAHALGFRPHTDTSVLTVLNQVNNLSGLQVLHKDKWVRVDPVPGALIVNCGDLIHILTNGRFTPPKHRVIPLESKHRFSAVLFYGPPYDTPFAPVSKLVEPGHLPLFQPVSWKEYINRKHGADVVLPVYLQMDRVDSSKEVDKE